MSGTADTQRSLTFIEKSTTKTLNILQLNVNGTQRKIDELTYLLHKYNVHVACLQETKLSSKLNLKIKGYTVIRKDRTDSNGGGLAFLIRTPIIKFREFSSNSHPNMNSNTEAHAINLELPNSSVTIVNVYHPDNSPIDTDLIQNLSTDSSDVKFILGDFNAKSPTWGCLQLDNKGAQIEDLLSDLCLSTLNTGENTYVSKTNGRASALDITAVSQSHLNIVDWRVIKSAISDHFPIISTLFLDVDSAPQVKRSWNFRKANWSDFTENLEIFCSQMPVIRNLDSSVQELVLSVQKAAKLSIPRGKRKHDWVPFWKEHNIDSMIDERDAVCRELVINNSEEKRRKLISISHKIEDEIAACKREKWADFCSKLDPRKDHQHWKVIKILDNNGTQKNNCPTSNIISVNGVSAKTDKDIANILAQHYEKASRLEFYKDDKKQKGIYKKIINENKHYTQKDIFSEELTMEELECAIQCIDPNKSPGFDLVFGPMIKNFGERAKLILLQIFNLSWKTGKLPNSWKISIIAPILKAGKDATDCKSYRPIALTSTLCKLMERIIHTRIMTWLSNQKILHFYQTAYRAQHSTVDQLFYLVQTIIDGLQEKPHKKTTAIFLDLSAAFDRVWRQKLIEILYKVGIFGNSLLWINDFLRKRKFVVKVNGKFSSTHRSWAGVPQGSVLSPLLFLLYMNSIHDHISNEAKIACYADDIAIWHTHTDIIASERVLNLNMTNIEVWAKNLKMLINPEKTKLCVFTTDRRSRNTYRPDIKICDSSIEQIIHPKYLGLTLDPELRFTKHMESISLRALKKLNILRKLCGSTWGSRPKTLLNTYTTLIRPILEYAAPIWAPASSTAKKKIDSVQYRASKTIIGAVSSTNNVKAEDECGLLPLENRRKLATIKFTNKIRSSNDNHISNITYQAWPAKNRLKRSSTLQFDNDIREEINLDHKYLKVIREPVIILRPPSSVTINLNLLEPCSKKELTETINKKGLDTISKLRGPRLVEVYTDGSSDSNCNKGGAGFFFIYPDGSSSKHRVPVGKIASNFTSELVAIKEALIVFLSLADSFDGVLVFSDCRSALQAIKKGNSYYSHEIITLLNLIIAKKNSCTLQWIPAHVNIEGNEVADCLAKEARELEPSPLTTTLSDINTVARQKLSLRTRKNADIPELNCTRDITVTIARLRTGHLKGMKILPDGSRIYRECIYCPNTQLDPEHLLCCPAIASSMFHLDCNWTKDILYSNKVEDVAKLVLGTFGPI